MFDSPAKLALGLLTGMIFGFLLQKGRVAKFEVIVGQFLLKDWTVVKMMGTAVMVGSVGVYALVWAELAALHIRPLQWSGILLGALFFGVGMATLGYCPGTTVAACGEGRRDAMLGVLGMLAGAWFFVVFNDRLQPVINGLGDSGKVTLPEVTGTSAWLWISLLMAAGIAGFFIDQLRRHSTSRVNRPASPSPLP
jgi:uncharacterized protein